MVYNWAMPIVRKYLLRLPIVPTEKKKKNEITKWTHVNLGFLMPTLFTDGLVFGASIKLQNLHMNINYICFTYPTYLLMYFINFIESTRPKTNEKEKEK